MTVPFHIYTQPIITNAQYCFTIFNFGFHVNFWNPTLSWDLYLMALEIKLRKMLSRYMSLYITVAALEKSLLIMAPDWDI